MNLHGTFLLLLPKPGSNPENLLQTTALAKWVLPGDGTLLSATEKWDIEPRKDMEGN